MNEHLIITGGRMYRIPVGDDEDMDASLEWWVESRGTPGGTVATAPTSSCAF